MAGQERGGEQISGDHHHTKALKKRYELNAQEKCVRGCLRTGETLLTYLQRRMEEICAHIHRDGSFPYSYMRIWGPLHGALFDVDDYYAEEIGNFFYLGKIYS